MMQSDTESTRILQEHCLKNPIEENRRPTNARFIFVFILIILLWFAVGSQAFIRGSTNKFNDDSISYDDDLVFVLYRYVNASLPYLSPDKETFGRVFLFSLFFGGISVFNCIVLIKVFTRQFVYLCLLIFMVIIILGCIFTILAQNLLINVVAGFSLLYVITVLFCMPKVGLKTLCELVKNTTRAILDCPATLFFTFLIVALEISTVVFTITSLEIILSSNDSNFLIIYLSLIMLIGGIMISTFVILFAIAVISEYTVNWCWITNRDEIWSGLFLQSFTTVFRNHIGTIALQSTLIIPFICAIIRAIKYRNKSARTRNISDIYLESISKATLVSSITHTSLIHTSIYGSNLAKAIKKTFHLVVTNAALYLSSIEIFNMIAVIGVMGNTIVMFFTAYGMVRIEHMPVHNMPLPYFWGFYFPAAAYCILMISIGRAMTTNKMIVLNAERDPEFAF